MNETLQVRRMRVRYRVRREDTALRRRLDGMLAAVLSDGLEPALARSGVAVDEEICVRTVRSAVRIDPAAGDAAVVAAWSAAIAAALADATSGASRDVVRYRNRRAALVDLALGVASDDLARVWAWRQLELWPSSDGAVASPAAVLVEALASDPVAIVPVLAEIAKRGWIARLLAAVDAAGWTALARAALAVSRVSADALETWPALPARRRAAETPRSARVARRILDESALARAALAAGAAVAHASAELRAAVAVLAWLEAEPAGLAVAPPSDIAAVVARAASELAEPAPPHAEAKDGEQDGNEPTPSERRWTTKHGGLLFLLGIVDELALPAEIATAAALDARPLRWTLHRLGCAITRADPGDPAVLAFAGLAPDAELPMAGAPSDLELETIQQLAGRIAERVRERLGGPLTPPDELLDFVTRRRSEIVVDPGWIELRLATEELSVDLRRAGLDLDPGWLPWLGAVVRFAYV